VIASLLILLGAPSLARAAEQAASIPGGKAPLWGTLEVPDNRRPSEVAVLILPGSGPTDRDGNSALGPAPNELKQLADALAGAGISSLRIDKRGVAASAAAAPPEVELRFTTYVDDAVAWANWLRSRPAVHCVVLIGHSEGALIAFAAAQRANACGVISLEGPGRPLSYVLRSQFRRQLHEPLLAKALAALDQLSSGRTVADPPVEFSALFRPSAQPYLISELALDPAVEAAKLQQPLLLVQGDKDQQVTLEDFERLKAARPDATAILVPGMIHPLKILPPELQPHSLTNLPLAGGVSEAIIQFVDGVQKAQPDR
jgi:hypothetical protein